MSGGRTVRQWAVAALVLLIGADAAQSEIRLPKLVGDHMVLQRDAPVRLWGWAEPGEPVQIDFQGLRVTARAAADGRWEAVIGPYSAGGPYEMSLHGRNQITLHDILIGDVWLASGQSNMEFPLQRARRPG